MREALNNEIASREKQLSVLTDTLTALIDAGASDAVIESIMQAIDVLDAATPSPTETETEDEPNEPEDEPTTRKQLIATLRSYGYQAPGLDALITLYHRDLAEQEWRKAEDATRGQMTHAQYRGAYDTRRFWFCTLREARKYASDELLTWFDENGRLTRAQLRDQLLTGKHYAGSGYVNDR